VDMRDPYWVYGGLQDNHSFFGPSETRRWAGILNDDWMQNGFGDGMYWQVDPNDAKYAYGSSNGGSYFRYDTETGDMVDIAPPEPLDEEYRFDWTSPMLLSEHDPNILYVAGNRLFISHDRGGTWERTEDLSRGVDRDTLELMGVEGSEISISRHDGTSSFGEAVTLDESPLDPAILWVGFDDGNLQVSRDGGITWTEVSGNVPVADGTYVSRITASAFDPGTAYAAFDGHRDGDFSPYLFRTSDFGVTWEPLHRSLPGMGVVNDVVEHPDNPETLFLGTEHHAFASTDGGSTWARIPNLPTTHYDDILIHPREKDLVLGTHGQGIWILDDTGPLADWASATSPVTVFAVQDGTIHIYKKDTSYRGQEPFAGENPPDGVLVTYRIDTGVGGDATLRVHDDAGNLVREMTVPGSTGTHRVNWDLRHGVPGDEVQRWARWDDPVLARPIEDWGPWVSPGTYTVTVEAGGESDFSEVVVHGDPLMPVTLAMYEARERFMLDALALQEEIRDVMSQNGMSGSGRRFWGGDDEAPETPEEKLRAASRLVGGVYRDLNGGGVRQATLYPPTPSQREQVRMARRLLEEARREMAS
ncbi:MAG: hypothetical protein R3304_11055, partial [Longimicrobiales bacterium]|nr:hypothetical protein [Longimicrobiales bacterium]